MQTSKKKIIKDTAFLSAGQYLAQISNIIRGFAVAAFLSPASYGLWSKILYYINYLPFLTLGSDLNIGREINQNISDNDRAHFLIKHYITYIKRITTVFFFLIVLAIILNNTIMLNKVRDIFFVNMLLMFIFSSLSLILFYRIPVVLLPSYGLFKHAALNRIINALANLAFVFIFCPHFGIYGMFIAYLFSLFAPMFFLSYILRSEIKDYIEHVYRKKKSIPIQDFNKMKFFRTSASMVIVSFLLQLWMKYDLFFTTFLFDNATAGPYFFGANISGSLMAIIMSAGGVISQNMNVNFGKGVTKEKLYKNLISSMQAFSIFHPLLLILIFYLAPLIIMSFFKKYSLSINYLQILLFLNLFLAHFLLAYFFFMAFKKQVLFLKYITTCLIINAVIYIVFAKTWSLASFPVIAIVSNYFFGIFLFIKLRKICESKINLFKIIHIYTYPAVSFFLAVYMSNFLMTRIHAPEIISALSRTFISLVLYITLILFSNPIYPDKLNLKIFSKFIKN